MKRTLLVLLELLLFAALTADAQFDWITNPNGSAAILTGYTGSGGAVTYPATIGGLPVAGLDWGLFCYCANPVSLTIPASFTGIEVTGDVGGCSSLASVTFLDGFASIGNYGFENCSGLTSVAIPGKVTNIGSFAFAGCTSLPSVTIPNSVINLGDNAFYFCTGLANVTLEDGLTSIGGSAVFEGCTRLTNVTIPPSVNSIGSYAFASCTNLPSVTIPAVVTNMGYGAFIFCSGLLSV
jgi:hypothetical protein